MKKILNFLTLLGVIFSASITAVSCSSPQSSNVGNNQSSNNDSQYSEFEKLSKHKIFLINLDDQNVKEFLNYVSNDSNKIGAELPQYTIDKSSNTFTLNFSENKNITFNVDYKVQASKLLNTDSIGEIDLVDNFNNLYDTLINKYYFPKEIKEYKFKQEEIINQTYHYVDKVNFNFDEIYDKSSWDDYYLKYFINTYGSVTVNFLPEKRIDKLVDQEIINSFAEVSTNDVYEYYSNKEGFKSNYEKYKIDAKKFTTYYDRDSQFCLKYEQGFWGFVNIGKNNQTQYDLNKITFTTVFNDSEQVENQKEIWTEKIKKIIVQSSQCSDDDVNRYLEINIDENLRKYSVAPKSDLPKIFNPFKNILKGNLTGPIKAQTVLKNTYLGVVPWSTIYFKKQGQTYYNKTQIIETISKVNDYDVQENQVMLESNSFSGQGELKVSFVKPFMTSEDYLFGTIVFKLSYIGDNNILETDENKFSYDVWIENWNKFLSLSDKADMYFYRTITNTKINKFYIYNTLTNKKVNIDLEQKLNVKANSIKNVFALNDYSILVSFEDINPIVVNLTVDSDEVTFTKLDADELLIDDVQDVKFSNDNMLILNGTNVLFSFKNLQFSERIGVSGDYGEISNYEIYDDQVIYATNKNYVFYTVLNSNILHKVNLSSALGNDESKKIKFILKNNSIHIFTKSMQNTSFWTYYRYDIDQANLKASNSVIGLEYNRDIDSVFVDNLGNVLVSSVSRIANNYYIFISSIKTVDDSNKDIVKIFYTLSKTQIKNNTHLSGSTGMALLKSIISYDSVENKVYVSKTIFNRYVGDVYIYKVNQVIAYY
ncbi:hypothetical protein SHELI_v1c04630 [Spiroplasma helicoides]|uniref:Lipoprotein n=1 Tax=Spiroplasma helicoides TaxID=216938 RepID=A0A1B3SKG5_9MOLU|nr:hypothetical protein [Spiroplasma helicoides]AOG60414.1 hypothetical protein SHELI_v1c04630 [Spiroplasma helicoides]